MTFPQLCLAHLGLHLPTTATEASMEAWLLCLSMKEVKAFGPYGFNQAMLDTALDHATQLWDELAAFRAGNITLAQVDCAQGFYPICSYCEYNGDCPKFPQGVQMPQWEPALEKLAALKEQRTALDNEIKEMETVLELVHRQAGTRDWVDTGKYRFRMIRSKDVLNCLPLLASVLGDQYGVQIRIGGNEACTNGKIIYLPALPMNCEPELLAMARGFVDHEAAHIRHTDFPTLKTANLAPVTFNLFNCLEDWRIEKKLSAIFPGCRQNLNWLIRRFFVEEAQPRAGGDSPALAVLDYVLLTVRAWDVEEVNIPRMSQAKPFPSLLCSFWGALLLHYHLRGKQTEIDRSYQKA